MKGPLSLKTQWIIFAVVALFALPVLALDRYYHEDSGWEPWQRAINILLIAAVAFTVRWHFLSAKRQFSLRSLLALVTLVAVTLGLIAFWGIW